MKLPPKPKVAFYPDNIPKELKEIPNWVCWRFLWKSTGKWSKVPVSPITGFGASTKTPRHWATFQQALDFMIESDDLDGIGFVFSRGCGVFGIDVDGAREDPGGKVSDTALAVFNSVESYAEWSPSKTGFHILCLGELPGPGFCNMQAGVEMYDDSRFFTVTGDIIWERGELLSPRPAVVRSLYDQYRTGATSDRTAQDSSPVPSPDPDHPALVEPQLTEITEGLDPSDRHKGDHSQAYFTLTRELLGLGWTAPQILHVLSDPSNGISRGAIRRRPDLAGARQWLWHYAISPAVASHNARNPDLSSFFSNYETNDDHSREVSDAGYAPPLDGAGYPNSCANTPNKGTDVPNKGSLLFHTPATIPANYRPLRHLVRDVVALRSASVLVSPPNVGKSALALDLALAVATGTPWGAHQREVNRGPVLYLAAESPRSILQRMEALRHGGKLDDSTPIMVTDFTIDLSTPHSRDKTAQQLAELFRQSTTLYGTPPVLIIVDTLGRAAPAIDENSFEDMGGLTDWIIRQAHHPKAIEAHWMVVHHTGKDTTRGARGHSSITGNFDTEIHLERNEDTPHPKQIQIKFHKQRDLPGKDTTRFFYHIEEWRTGHKVPDFGHDETAAIAVHDLEQATTVTDHEREVDRVATRNAVVDGILAKGQDGLVSCAAAAGLSPEKFKQAIEFWNMTDPGAIIIDYGAGFQNRNVYRLGPAGLQNAEDRGLEVEQSDPSNTGVWEMRTGRYLRAVREHGLDGSNAMGDSCGVERGNFLRALRRLADRGLVQSGESGKLSGKVTPWWLTDAGRAELDAGGEV